VGASCTHYGGPLSEGLVVGRELRCPLHHACFSLRTGEALRAPAFDPIARWRTEVIEDVVFVREKLPGEAPAAAPAVIGRGSVPTSVVIVGGGAAGFSAADTLRREGYAGSLTLVSADEVAPYDRPNLSKDYLAGKAPAEWLPLRPSEYYEERNVELVLNATATAIDVRRKEVRLTSGRVLGFDRLLIATGAEPVRPTLPGASSEQVLYLRSYADCRALITRAESARQVLILGGGFIGLEVAASLRERGIAVHVLMRDKLPLEHVLGAELGAFVRELHEEHGVVFHVGDSLRGLNGRTAQLASGKSVEVDFLVAGFGVRPSSGLGERAGLRTEGGIVVNEFLETNAPGVFAAGDVACWPNPRSGKLIRVEHWVVAEREGQAAARNLLGEHRPFRAVPYFWTSQYDVAIRYVGYSDRSDGVEITGDPRARDCLVSFKQGDETLAVATISRDRANLEAEVAMEEVWHT
jgi:apoptosis-inducing factor 3